MQLALLDALVLAVGNVDGTGSQQHRLSPVGKPWDVRSECGHHGWNPGHGAEACEGDLEHEVHLGAVTDGFDDLALQIVGGTDQAIEKLGTREGRNDVGSVPAFDSTNVHGTRANLGITG